MSTFKRFTNKVIASRNYGLGLFVLRVSAGAMMMTHGLEKMRNFGELSASFPDPIGMGSHMSLILIIFAEFFCSALIALGLLSRLAAIPLIIGMTVAAFFTFPEFTLGGSELALLYLTVFTTVFITGAGRYSIDHVIGRSFSHDDF